MDQHEINGTGTDVAEPNAPAPGPDAPAPESADTAAEPPTAPATATTPAFLDELARAMRDTAERERQRIADAVSADAAHHAELTQTRAASESEALRRLAEQDIERIHEWQADEIRRIRMESERRTAERRSDLEVYLGQHEAVIGKELEAIDAAVGEYHETLGRFFDELGTTSDPAEIARRAGTLPPVPDFEQVRAAARAGAVAQVAVTDPSTASDDDRAGVGVMAPEAIAANGQVGADTAAAPEAAASDAGLVKESADRENAAVRMLRTLAPWTQPADRNGEDSPPRP